MDRREILQPTPAEVRYTSLEGAYPQAVRRCALLGGVVVLALSCGRASLPLGRWYPSEPCIPEGGVICADPRSVSSPIEIPPVPAPNEHGPRLLVSDVIGSLAVSDAALYYVPFSIGRLQEICMLPKAGGLRSCFPGVAPRVLHDLHADGPWLLGVAHGRDPRIARIHREHHAVEFLPLFDEGEKPRAVSFGTGAEICVVVGRDAPLTRALVRVPKAGGSPATLVPFGEVHGDVVACDATDAYFVGESGLARVPLRGGPPAVLGTSAYRIALAPRAVYVAGPHGIARLPKRSTELARIAPASPQWKLDEPVIELRAFAGGVAWGEERRQRPYFAIRWCLEERGCETLMESDGSLRLVGAEDGVAYWTSDASRQLHAARGPAKLNVAGEGR
jgi:hypothetical protein